jgi:hypothetical protein
MLRARLRMLRTGLPWRGESETGVQGARSALPEAWTRSTGCGQALREGVWHVRCRLPKTPHHGYIMTSYATCHLARPIEPASSSRWGPNSMKSLSWSEEEHSDSGRGISPKGDIAVLGLYLLLAIALTYPLALDFTTHVPGDGGEPASPAAPGSGTAWVAIIRRLR